MFFSKTKRQIISFSLIFLQAAFPGGMAYAMPHNHVVTSGKATFTTFGNILTIDQSTSFLKTKWSSFNIWTGQTVKFVQPSKTSLAINTILGNTATNIFGKLLSNGQVWLINPNGVVFGPGAEVNTRGLLVSAMNLNGTNYSQPSFSGNGSVLNEGSLTGEYYLALLGSNVDNKGTLSGRKVDLLAGNNISLTFANDDLLSYSINSNTIPAMVTNSGKIMANGGAIWIAAGAKNALTESVVNNTGILDAETLSSGKSGEIWLLAGSKNGTVNVGGTINASAPINGNGGSIDTSAGRVNILSNLDISTSSRNGQSGIWTIDPNSFYIGENTSSPNSTWGNITGYEDISGSQLSTDLGMTNIVIDSTMGGKGSLGNVYVDSPVTWSGLNSLTLNAANNVIVNAPISSTGSGSIILRADDLSIGGAVSQNSNGIPSGMGSVFINSSGSVGTRQGMLAVYTNPENYSNAVSNPGSGGTYFNATAGGAPIQVFDLLSSYSDLAFIDNNQSSQILSNNYALNQNFLLPTGPSTGNWIPFGTLATPFTGVFNGQGHSVSEMVINTPSNEYVGFFGVSNGTIENFGLVSPNVNGSTYVGALAGLSNGNNLSNYVSSGSVTGSVNYAGGMFGELNGSGQNLWSTATINMDLASAASGDFGGLIGFFKSGASITNSWSGGPIANIGSGTPTYGGFLGYSTGSCSSVCNDYYNSSIVSTGVSQPSWITALTTTQFSSPSNWSGFTFNSFSGTGGFSSSIYTNPWVLGTVNGGGTTYQAPILVGDMNKDSIVATTRTISYTGNLSDTLVQNATPGTFLLTGLTAESGSSDVGTSLASPVVNALNAPTTQSGTAYFVLPGVQTITPDNLSIFTNATKTYDGNNILDISGNNSSISGLVSGQSASIATLLNVSLSSDNVGQNIGGTISLSNSDLSGNTAFNSALSHGDYILPGSFGGGTITPRVLTMNTSATKKFNGSNSIVLNTENTTISGMVPGQTAYLASPVTGEFYSNSGRNIGGQVSGPVFGGNVQFLNALLAKDYVFSDVFTGGSIIGRKPVSPLTSSVIASVESVGSLTSANADSSYDPGHSCSNAQCSNQIKKPGDNHHEHSKKLALGFIQVISLKNGGVKLPDNILEVSPYTLLGLWDNVDTTGK